ncbi:uncharacterized protein [Eucyclogobius newberryi]|uniref:uncharacterized protein n=1 Tax=Eucyclogobius newberryi TaxID=166745 RepID=UPI003B5C82E0
MGRSFRQSSSDSLQKYQFTHVTSSPRYPQANGEAERAIRTIKDLWKKDSDYNRALLAYRATPLEHGFSPAQLLMGRNLRTTLPQHTTKLDPTWPDLQTFRKKDEERRPPQKVFRRDSGEAGETIPKPLQHTQNMKNTLLLSLALTIALSINSVAGLSCTTCSDPNDSNCVSTILAPCQNGEVQCVSATIQTKSGPSTSTTKVKGCAASSLCPASMTQDFSLNVGSSQVLAKAVCCSSDNCNTADAPAPSTPGTGSLQCFSCDPTTGTCSTGLTCNTLENNCFSSRGQ